MLFESQGIFNSFEFVHRRCGRLLLFGRGTAQHVRLNVDIVPSSRRRDPLLRLNWKTRQV